MTSTNDSRAHAAEPAPSAASVDQTSKDSFPASDPPASHLPDLPPANAEDKWRAVRENEEALDRKPAGVSDQTVPTPTPPQVKAESQQSGKRGKASR